MNRLHVSSKLSLGWKVYCCWTLAAIAWPRSTDISFKEVGFGWGILGHLDKGGHFLVQQQEITDNYWAISSMKLDITGKVLLVKSLVFSMTEVFSDFKQVPKDITFAQAVEMLEKEETVLPRTSPLAG